MLDEAGGVNASTIWVDQDGRAAIIDAVLDALNPSQGRLAMARAWISQDGKHVAKVGKDRASYYVNWYDPDGRQRQKSCGPGADGLRNARKLKRQVEAQLLTGTYNCNLRKTWDEFRQQYEAQILSGKSAATRRQANMSLNNFERVVNPKLVSAVKTATVDQFTARRRQELRRYSKTEHVSPSSVNADLRNLKAALTVAHDWGFLEAVPRFRFMREPGRLPVYVTPDDFAAVYRVCDRATVPEIQGCSAGDWWRAFAVMAYVATGWRVGQLLGLRRDDLDLDAGTAITRAAACGNKGRRDMEVALHPLAVEHLHKLAGFSECVFVWPHDRRTLAAQWQRLCKAAGVRRYPLSALRKGFGSLNAPRLSPAALQHLMQHRSSATTLKFYVNPLAAQSEVVERLFVPPGLERTG